MRSETLRQLLATVVGTVPRHAAVALLLLLLAGLAQGVGLLMLIPLLDLVGIEVGAGTASWFVQMIEQALRILGVPVSLATVLLLFVLVMGCRALLDRSSKLAAAALQIELAADVKQRLYNSIIRSNWLFFTQNRASDFTHVITDQVMRMTAAMDGLLRMVATAIMGLVYVILSVTLSPLLSILVLSVGLLLFVAFRNYNEEAHTLGRRWQEVMQSVYAALSESFSAMKVVKSHGLEDRQTQSFSHLTDGLVAVYRAVFKARADLGFLLSISSVVLLSIFVYFALTVLQVSAAVLLMLIYLFSRLLPTFTGLQSQYQQVANVLPAFEAITDLQVRSDAAQEQAQRSKPVRFEHELRLENVSFRYEDRSDLPALSNVELTVACGKTTAIVGPSGSGKTTVADLIIGLIEPSKGRILVDDSPLDSAWLHNWRDQVAYVPQEGFLFHDTLRANLRVLRPEASDEELMEALKFAVADEFVGRLPEGLDTVLGDRGVRLSGGERQRLALARALLRRPALLVLDEATSALDSESEAKVQQAVEQLHGTVTILVIAHRLSSVRNANVIYVLDQGRVVESGDWARLLSLEGGRVQALYRDQGLRPDRQAG